MITYKNSETALKASIILVISVFILILYSTFLTRSGVLGDASVHSFTDLGLSGQLLLYLLFFLLVAVVLAIVRWKEIPSSAKEISTYSREFWIFIGATVLCLMGFQVLVPTSFPAWNQLVEAFGGTSNIAIPGDQVEYFSKFQIWFAIAIGSLSAIGQYFWWKKIDRKELVNQLFVPFVSALLIALIIVNTARVYNLSYALLLFAGLFTVFSNGKILYGILKANPGLSGGAVAHIGVGLMLVGILFSSGYSTVVSLNNTGMLISRQLSDEFNRENLLLFVNEPREMAGYEIEYLGERVEPRYKSGYVDKSDVEYTDEVGMVIAKRDIDLNGKPMYKAGERFEIHHENTFYQIEFRKNGKPVFVQYPRVQVNPRFGNMASPDLNRKATMDLYTFISAPMTEEAKDDWDTTEEFRVKRATQFFANDYVASVEEIKRVYEIAGQPIDSSFVAIEAAIRVQGERKEYIADPILIIGTQSRGGIIPGIIPELGLKISLLNIHPESDEMTISISTRQKDWVVIKALEKPFVNVLWIGTLVLMAGFSIAMVRRFRDFKLMKAKGLE
jgi:cytochrome c-type biogenesis protein CcmF